MSSFPHGTSDTTPPGRARTICRSASRMSPGFHDDDADARRRQAAPGDLRFAITPHTRYEEPAGFTMRSDKRQAESSVEYADALIIARACPRQRSAADGSAGRIPGALMLLQKTSPIALRPAFYFAATCAHRLMGQATPLHDYAGFKALADVSYSICHTPACRRQSVARRRSPHEQAHNFLIMPRLVARRCRRQGLVMPPAW